MTTEPAATPAVKTPKRGVGFVIREALLAGADNEAALAAAKAEFPQAATTVATVSWYRNQLRQEGKNVLSARDLKKKQIAEAAAAASAASAKGEPDPLG
jgi:hypothetical protein